MAGATVLTRFTAQDKMSAVLKGISQNVKGLSSSFTHVEHLNQKFAKSFDSLTGVLGKIGLGFGVLGIATSVVNANLQVEDSLASLQAITGVTGDAFKTFEKQISKVSNAQNYFAADTAKVFEVVGSAMPELLKDADKLGNVSNSVLTLSKAARMSAEDSAKALTSSMNQFGLGADQADRAINVLAAGAKFGASGIQPTIDALTKFGTIAANIGVDLEESIGAIEVLSKFEKGSEAGTSLRNVLATLSGAKLLPKDSAKVLRRFGVNTRIVTDQTISLADRLQEMSKIAGDATAIQQVFGKENSAAATAMLKNVDTLRQMTSDVSGTGEALVQANKQTETITATLTALNNKWMNIISTTNTQNKTWAITRKLLVFVINNMERLISIAIVLAGTFVIIKAVIIAYNTYMKLSILWTKGLILANMMLGTSFTIAFGPISLIIAAVIATIAIIVQVIRKYDEWGAALTFLMGPIGVIINLIMSFRRHWDDVKKAFKEGGIIQGIKMIGKVIFDALLMPIQQLLELIAKIPGLGIAGTGAENLKAYREKLFPGPLGESPTTTTTAHNSNIIEKTQRQDVGVTFNNLPEGASVTTSGDNIAEFNFIGTTGAFMK